MRGWMMMMALSLPLTALAQTSTQTDSNASASAPAPTEGFGSQTRLWLSTQVSGTNSVTEQRPMPGEVATQVYQRYLNSFTHPIPEHYASESFSAASGGTSGSSSSTP
jgi:hypothetical protein